MGFAVSPEVTKKEKDLYDLIAKMEKELPKPTPKQVKEDPVIGIKLLH